MLVTIQLDGPQLHFYADQKMHVELGFFDDKSPPKFGWFEPSRLRELRFV